MEIIRIKSGKLDNNTYVVSKEKYCIIIDASADVATLRDVIKDKKVLAVFLTHAHYDHFENLDNIVKFFKTKCYVSMKDYVKLFNPKFNYSISFGLPKESKLESDNFVLIDDSRNYRIGSFNIKVFITPGHTDGSICIDIENNLFTGDTKFYYGCGRTDLLTGSDEDMEKSLEFIDKNYKLENIYPGHGRTGKI